MNSRRFICSNCISVPVSQGRLLGYRTGEDQSAGIAGNLQPVSGTDVRGGSFASLRRAARLRRMSAMPSIATESVRRNEPTRCDKNRHPDPKKPRRLASLANQGETSNRQRTNQLASTACAPTPDHSIGFGVGVGVELDVSIGANMGKLTCPAAVNGLPASPMNVKAVSPFPALPSASIRLSTIRSPSAALKSPDGIRVGVERGAHLGDRMPDEDVPTIAAPHGIEARAANDDIVAGVADDDVGVFVAGQTDRCRRGRIGGPEDLDLRTGREAVAHAGPDLVGALVADLDDRRRPHCRRSRCRRRCRPASYRRRRRHRAYRCRSRPRNTSAPSMPMSLLTPSSPHRMSA